MTPPSMAIKADAVQPGALWLLLASAGEKDATLAQKLGPLTPFIVVLPQECMRQLASFGPT